ncbi:hypothetical protein BH24PSE2_BH24PSE2_18800 [soil metagenome]
MSGRIQKLLADAGIGSRRAIDALVASGRLTVDGKPARPGDRITGTERIAIDGRPVRLAVSAASTPRAIAYHKPVGEITTRKDPERRPSVFAQLPRLRGGRWVSVGRLDMNSSGLMIFTTDGDLAHRLMHPSQGVEREYAVRVLGELSDTAVEALLEGIELDDGVARLDRIEPGGGRGANRWYRATLREGRNREIRRLFAATGCRVNRLIRVRYGTVTLGRSLRPGQHRPLSRDELASLCRLAGIDPAAGLRVTPKRTGTRSTPSRRAQKPVSKRTQ